MTKELFIETLNFIKKKEDQNLKLCELFEEVPPNYRYYTTIIPECTDYILKLLRDAMQDKYDDILYFIRDLDAFNREGMIIPKELAPQDNDKPQYYSPETLYDYLSSNIK